MIRMFVSLLGGIFTLAAVSAATAENTKVVIAYTGATDYTAAYVAKDEGIFTKHGLDVELRLVANGGVATAAVTSGTAQFGGLTPSVLLPAVANGLDLIVGASGHVVPTGSKLGLLGRSDLDLSAKGAFTGKTIGVPGFNGALHVLTRRWLTDRGEDLSQVNFVELAFGQMPGALRGKQVDLVASADPFFDQIVSEKLAAPVGDILSVLPNDSLISFYATSRAWASQNRETVVKFTAALDEAAEFVKKNPEAARKAIGNYVKLSPDLISKLPMPGLKAKASPEQLVPWIEMALQQGIIPANIDPKTLVFE